MWRVHSITTLTKQCLSITQRRCSNLLFYSTAARKPSAPKSGNYEISGIYSGVHSSKPQAPFLKALKDVQKEGKGEKGGKRGGDRERVGRKGAFSRKKSEEKGEENEERGGSARRERRERNGKRGMKAKGKKDTNKLESEQPTKTRMKKRKVEPFVIYKAPAPPPKIEEEEDDGDEGEYENTMFVKKLKPSDKREKGEPQVGESKKKKPAKKDVPADKEEITTVVKAEKAGFKNNMFGQETELLEGDEIVDSAEEEAELGLSDGVKDKIRQIGEGGGGEWRKDKEGGDLFVLKTVQQSEDDMRMDRWAGINFPALPHSKLCKFLRNKLIYYSTPPDIQRKKASIDTRLKAGNIVHVYTKLGLDTNVQKKAPIVRLSDNELDVIRSWIIHKDDHLLIINKPFGLPVQGGTKVGRHLAQLLHALRGDKDDEPRLVHRLDRDTSGVLVLARSRQAAIKLTEMFKNNKITKIYWALIAGVPKTPIGRINMPLEKVTGPRGDERVVPREKISKTAKAASTDYNVVEELSSTSFVVLAPSTGRTHQLRVHCAAALGAHIVGDQKYGDGKEVDSLEEILETVPNKLHLHARRIVFKHPFTNVRINVAAKLPEHMLHTWTALGLNPNYKEKLSEIAENPDKQESQNSKLPDKSYGKKGNVRKSIWKPKISNTPIRDMKMRAAMTKHKKNLHKSKVRKIRKAEKEKKDEKGGEKRKGSRAAILKEKQYRAKRRMRPVRKLAPKIKR